jgi:SAM-dependent methyltransferase
MTMSAPPPPDCREVLGRLDAYLQRGLLGAGRDRVRTHLDACRACWSSWNQRRWDIAMGSPLIDELREYLGPRFRPGFDSSRALGQEWESASPRTLADVRRFYRHSESYLYNLAIWHASGNRPDYLGAAWPHLTGARVVLDYGCGIGQDTLALRSAGLAVIPCDFPSPATRFLRWRLRRAGHRLHIADPCHLDSQAQVDTLWVIDTLDHLDDIAAWLGPALGHAERVICEDLTEPRAHGHQAFHFRRTHTEVAETFARFGLHQTAPGGTGLITVFHRAATSAGLHRPLGCRRHGPRPHP